MGGCLGAFDLGLERCVVDDHGLGGSAGGGVVAAGFGDGYLFGVVVGFVFRVEAAVFDFEFAVAEPGMNLSQIGMGGGVFDIGPKDAIELLLGLL